MVDIVGLGVAMSVKIIRPLDIIEYSVEQRKVRIEFKDGTHMVGFINIHSKYATGEEEEAEYHPNLTIDDSKFKFHRTSDYLKDCNQNEGMLTVFSASYGGHEDRICFVFLHSIKFISEEGEVRIKTAEKPQPQKEEPQHERTGLSLRDRLKQPE
jgi:hypothetical protein